VRFLPARPPKGPADADTWLALGAWVVIVLSCLQILLFGFGRDQGIYSAVADAIFGPYLKTCKQ